MPFKIPFTIANILVELSSPISASHLGIQRRLGPFFGVPEKPAGRVSLAWQESPEPPKPLGELIYDPGYIVTIYREGNDYYAALRYYAERGRPQKQCVLRANSAWDSLTLIEQRTGGSTWGSLLNVGAGELILRTALLAGGGLIFHSSGLDDNGNGIVFVGHTGAGKSTQLGLWSGEPGVIAINHDRIIVRAEENAVMCYGAPWGGTADIASNHSAPLKALVLLEQSPENSIGPIPVAAASGLLAARAFLPYWDLALMKLALANLNSILERVPVYRLRCRPEKAVIPLVRSVL